MTACRHGRSQCPDPLELGQARPDEIPVDPEHSAQSAGGWLITLRSRSSMNPETSDITPQSDCLQ